MLGPAHENEIGNWITSLIPVQTFVDERHRKWRPLVEDSFHYFFTHLSKERLSTKIQEQLSLPLDTSAERRLLQLIAKMPGLQKLGQVLARNPRLSPALRDALTYLENSLCDVGPGEIRAIVERELGSRLDRFAVELGPKILKEGSASAILPFTWRKPGRDRERGVFKVLKPYIPEFFGEDMTLLQSLGRFLSSEERRYEFQISDVQDMLREVRTLLEHELDFEQEQKTLADAHRTYRSNYGIRVPRLIRQLCTPNITAMSEEPCVKVTDAFRRSPIRRGRVSLQLIEALIAVPLFCREEVAVFHADPHAGNLMYDEANRELVVMDWALAGRLSLAERRHLVLLVVMAVLRNQAGLRDAMTALSRAARGRTGNWKNLIATHVERFFREFPPGRPPGALDAMRLLDHAALDGVPFPPSLFFFRKSVFTLDGVLHDVAGTQVRIDQVIMREFLTRWVGSFGLFFTPLQLKDLLAVQWNGLLLPLRTFTSFATAS